MERLTSIAVSLTLILITGSMIGSDLYVPPVDQDRPLAIVRRFKPVVELASADNQPFILDLTENIGEQLFSGDTLSTKEEGYALVIFMDNSVAKVKPESMLIVQGESLADSKITDRIINLESGEIFLDIQPQGSGSFEVGTSKSYASVKGTQFGSRAEGYYWVREGQVDVTARNSGRTVSLFERMFANVDQEGNEIDTGVLTDNELDDLDEGFNQLDEDMVEKTIIIRFRDANGQLREIPVQIFEKEN